MDSIVNRFEHWAEKFEAKKASLYRQDNSPMYSEGEHAERLAGYLRELRGEADYALDKLDTLERTARGKALVLEHGDPTAELDTEGLAAANNRRAFVQEDCDNLPLVALVDRVRAVRESGDVVGQFLYRRYAQWRLERVRAEGIADNGDGSWRSTLSADDAAALAALADELRALSDNGAKAEAVAKLRREQAAAMDARRKVTGRLRQLDGSRPEAFRITKF